MSKNKARRRPSASRPVNDSQIIDQPSAGNGLGLSLVSRMTMDEIINQYARLGGKQNLLGNNTYAANRITQQYQLLNSLYRGDWLAGKIVDTIPEDMVKNWYKLTCQVEPDQISILQNIERRTHLKTQILEGLRLGRLYGGAAGIIMIDGQEDMLETPLNMNTIMPGSFKGLIIADRWNGVYPSSSQVTDRSDPDYGLPEYYKFLMDETNTDYGISVHHSRVVRFTGRWLPYLERVIELQWGMSELEHVYDELNKRNSTSANIAQLVFQAHLRVLKMDKFGQALAFMDQRSQQALYRTLDAQNKLMNNMSLQIMSKDDEFQTFQYTFSGLSDVYEQFMMDVAGAAEIPVTKLFGRSPAGMNATGESDLINYYDTVKKWQEAQLRPILDKLLPILCLSAWGAIPDDLDFDFNPVRDISDSERSNLIKQSADAINSVFQSGIISQKIALKELRESGKPLDMWTNITDEDIDNADDSMNPQEQEPGLEELPVEPGNEEGQMQQMEGDIPPGAGIGNPTKAADAAPNRLLALLRRLLGRYGGIAMKDITIMRVLKKVRRMGMDTNDGLRHIVADSGSSFPEKQVAQAILKDPKAFDAFLNDGGPGSGRHPEGGASAQEKKTAISQSVKNYEDAMMEVLRREGLESANKANHMALERGLIGQEQFLAGAKILAKAFMEQDTADGGKGSGNFGHKGRPGQIGGSGGGGLTKVSGGEYHAKGYSLTSSTVGRSKGADRSFVSKGKPTAAMPKGTGSTVLAESDLKNGVHSCVKYLTPEGGLTPEREKVHADAVASVFEGKQPVPEGQQKTFYVLGGGPASGKSHLTNPETCAQFGMPSSKECATIDADEMKKKIPEYGIKNREAAANFTHEESSAMAKRAMQAAFDNGYNCTLDGTGDGSEASLRKKIQDAREKGYKVEGAYVTVPTEVAVERAVARGKKIGRVVPRKQIEKTHAAVSRIFPKVASEFDHVTLYDTSAGKPVLIAECSRGQEITVHNQQLYDAFLAKGQ